MMPEALALVFWLGLCFGAIAQEHHHPPQDARLHEQFYSTWLMPNGGTQRISSCCNMQDCYPTKIKRVAGQWFALRREDHKWIIIPDGRLEQNQGDPRESPDGQSHACMSKPGGNDTVYCAVLGGAS